MLMRWQALSPREKRTLGLSGIVVAILLGYALLWAPLVNQNQTLRHRLQQQQSLLQWMQHADAQMHSSLNRQPQKIHSTAAFMAVIETQLQQSALAKAASPLHQVGNNAIQVQFAKVNFDALIQWLTDLSLHNRVVVSEISLRISDTPGYVRASVNLIPAI